MAYKRKEVENIDGLLTNGKKKSLKSIWKISESCRWIRTERNNFPGFEKLLLFPYIDL